MKIKTSDNFPPTVSMDDEGDFVHGKLNEIRYVDTPKGQFPIAEFEGGHVQEKDGSPQDMDIFQIWISRKNLRPIEKLKVNKEYTILCTSAEGGFKGYGYEITQV